MKRINAEVKEMMVSLSGACFWYWDGFFDFLESNGVSRSISRALPKDNKYSVMRQVLSKLEEQEEESTISNLISSFYRLTGAVHSAELDTKKAKDLLAKFRTIVGTDPIEQHIKKMESEALRIAAMESSVQKRLYEEKIDALLIRYSKLNSYSELTPQRRGFELEKLIGDLILLNELEYSVPYKAAGEQIDGHFKYEAFDYLIEAKWLKSAVTQKELSIFDKKIDGKAQSTRGLFISMSGFDSNGIEKFSGHEPRILLFDGEDIFHILSKRISLSDALRAKLNRLIKYGEIYYPLRNVIL